MNNTKTGNLLAAGFLLSERCVCKAAPVVCGPAAASDAPEVLGASWRSGLLCFVLSYDPIIAYRTDKCNNSKFSALIHFGVVLLTQIFKGVT